MQNGKPAATETIKGKNKLAWLWETGRELYRTKWIRDWGDTPSETLEQLLGKLSAEQIKQGFAECIKQAQNGSEWPPVPITFISMCKTAGIDIDGSYERFLYRKPLLNNAEIKTRDQVGFNCRALPDEKARKLWAKNYRANYLLMVEGKLSKDQSIALTEHVTTTQFDIERQNYKPTNPKVKKMLARLEKARAKRDG